MNTAINALGDFKVFAAAKDILEKHIGSAIIYDIELNLKDKYSFSGDDLHWEMKDKEFSYSEEASFLKEFDDCEMYLVRSCCGNKFLFVFDKSNKVEG